MSSLRATELVNAAPQASPLGSLTVDRVIEKDIHDVDNIKTWYKHICLDIILGLNERLKKRLSTLAAINENAERPVREDDHEVNHYYRLLDAWCTAAAAKVSTDLNPCAWRYVGKVRQAILNLRSDQALPPNIVNMIAVRLVSLQLDLYKVTHIYRFEGSDIDDKARVFFHLAKKHQVYQVLNGHGLTFLAWDTSTGCRLRWYMVATMVSICHGCRGSRITTIELPPQPTDAKFNKHFTAFETTAETLTITLFPNAHHPIDLDRMLPEAMLSMQWIVDHHPRPKCEIYWEAEFIPVTQSPRIHHAIKSLHVHGLARTFPGRIPEMSVEVCADKAHWIHSIVENFTGIRELGFVNCDVSDSDTSRLKDWLKLRTSVLSSNPVRRGPKLPDISDIRSLFSLPIEFFVPKDSEVFRKWLHLPTLSSPDEQNDYSSADLVTFEMRRAIRKERRTMKLAVRRAREQYDGETDPGKHLIAANVASQARRHLRQQQKGRRS